MNEIPSGQAAPLPQLAAIFQGIKAGRHWCFGDPEYADLFGDRFEEYRAFFAQLELTLHRDTRGFVYATADDDDYKGSNLITRLVLFTAVWIDALADEGVDIGKSLFNQPLLTAELPHLNAESHRRILSQIGIQNPSDLIDTLRSLERLGFLAWEGQDRFSLRPAFNRLLDVCMNEKETSSPSAEAASIGNGSTLENENKERGL